MANETTLSLLTETVPTEDINSFVQSYEYPTPVGQLICWTRPSPLGSVAVRFPRWNQVNASTGVPAGTKTEGASFTRVTVDQTESSITPGLVGLEMALTDEVQRAAGVQGGVMAGVIIEALNAMSERIDTDILSSSTSATNTAGATSDNFTVTKFNAASAAYRALSIPNGPMGTAFVAHNDAIRDLVESWGSTSAPFQKDHALAAAFGPNAGYHGSYLGFQVFESANVPAEAPGWSNGMTPIGAGASGLGCAMTEAPSIRANRGSVGELDAEDMFILRAWYGAGLTNPSRYLEVLSRT